METSEGIDNIFGFDVMNVVPEKGELIGQKMVGIIVDKRTYWMPVETGYVHPVVKSVVKGKPNSQLGEPYTLDEFKLKHPRAGLALEKAYQTQIQA